MELVTQSARETQKLGEKIGHQLISGKIKERIFCLSGELGGGKTTFIQGLAKGLGIKERILSPTFIMVRPYAIRHTPYAAFYHVDLYRAESERDVESLGLEEIWSDSENIVAIEWSEKIKKILPKKRSDIYFKYLKVNQRQITIHLPAQAVHLP